MLRIHDNMNSNLQFNRSFEYYLSLFLTNFGHDIDRFLLDGLAMCHAPLKYEYFIPLFNLIEEINIVWVKKVKIISHYNL